MKILKRFHKNRALLTLNFAGLSIMLTCLLLSAGYIKREMSYDRHHANADEPQAGTLWKQSFNPLHPNLSITHCQKLYRNRASIRLLFPDSEFIFCRYPYKYSAAKSRF